MKNPEICKMLARSSLVWTLLFAAAAAHAALQGIDPDFPRFNYNNTGVTTYSASTGAFSVNADPLDLQLTSSGKRFVIGAPRDLRMHATLAADCSLLPGAPGSLAIEGVVYDPDTFIPVNSGVLLTGDLSAFNAGTAALNGQFELTFIASGGVLVDDGDITAGARIGVTLTAEGAGFPGHCELDWSGGAKGVIGSLPGERASLGDRVWEDVNNNGVQDCVDSNGNGLLGDVVPGQAHDPAASDQGPECGDRANGGAGIAGVDVYLYRPDLTGDCTVPMAVNPQVTGADGFYLFDDLDPGDYCVRFDIGSLPQGFCDTAGFALGKPQYTGRSVGGDAARDSDADPADGTTDAVTIAAADAYRDLDAGIVCPAKIGNYFWDDLDQDGLQDSDEPGIDGIAVNLYECGPNGETDLDPARFVGQRVTGADGAAGEYMFGAEPGVFDLMPGDYFVQFDPASLPAGYEFTIPNAAGDALNSDCMAPDGITACTTLGSRGINLDRDCGIYPTCGLKIDKQCRVETPPAVSDDAKCDGKLKQFTVIWSGAPISISGLPNDAPGGVVNTNQEVTFFGPFDSNDVFVDITGAVNGQSKFHMSCSDPDMDGTSASNDAQPQVSVVGRDCGKHQGDAKSNGDPGFINDWLLEGFVDNSDQVLDCTVPDSSAGFADDCSFTPGPAPSCDSLEGRPTSLTFMYTGGGCSASNNAQDPSKAVCTPDSSGDVVSADITVLYTGSDSDLSDNSYSIDTTAVALDGVFTVSSGSFSSNSYIQIGDGSATELNQFHTSCSQPLAVGDVFGSLTLVGINGQTGGVDVSYQYTVTNTGAPLTGVTVTDDLLGPVGAPFDLGYGDTAVLVAGPVSIADTTTNVATVSAAGALCSDSDAVTVTAVEPVCDVDVVFDRLEDDKLKYKVTNTSRIVATLESFVLDFPSAYGTIKEVKLDGGIYKASESSLLVGPGVTIHAADWTQSDVSRRELDPGETRTLEIVFTTKHKGGDWAGLAAAGGMVTFEEGCAISLRAPNACEIERPTELVFEYTGDACSATTNDQNGGFMCASATGSPIGSLLDVVVTKDASKIGIGVTGTGFSIYRSDEPGKEFPSEIKYDVIGSNGTQSQVLHTSCSKPLNLDDRFGALILRGFLPKTN